MAGETNPRARVLCVCGSQPKGSEWGPPVFVVNVSQARRPLATKEKRGATESRGTACARTRSEGRSTPRKSLREHATPVRKNPRRPYPQRRGGRAKRRREETQERDQTVSKCASFCLEIVSISRYYYTRWCMFYVERPVYFDVLLLNQGLPSWPLCLVVLARLLLQSAR